MKLAELTLGQYIDFYNHWGREHDKRAREILDMPEGEERNDRYVEYDVDVAMQTYSFYSGIPVDDLYKNVEYGVLSIYPKQNTIFAEQKLEELKLKCTGEYEWNGDKWAIQALFDYTPKMTHEQFQMSQDLALFFSDFQDGKIESLLYLCAMYFRKVGEKYTSDFASLDNERALLMRELPLSHALRVKKYMVDTMAVYNQMEQ